MDIEKFDKETKSGKVEVLKPQVFEADLPQPKKEMSATELDFAGIIVALRTIRQPLATVPTFVPKNFIEQIQFYESGATYRLYIYQNGVWRYTTLT
jgi:hypothetical protein